VSKPKYTIRLLRAAEEDLTGILEYISADNVTAADETLTRIEKNLQLLGSQPHLGRIPAEEDLVRMGYRFPVVLDYLIFYTLEDQTILVHRIVHGARDFLRLL
jgi:toxin ParE1/3/4